ncbi:transcriptional regulator, y4mF family [Megamonas hypermegale]|uniref:Transcriptional regulator, y4mF family n=1 Tax=Megamonas hypermegale TaxID=158847 RepID=A0A239TV75_9FIRM|nr:helix-turn-helix transcriptional regulator [Megamonas hypermegale]SNV01359.1 transcriptional regulator, y4mF family [Megamonas hypermegale]
MEIREELKKTGAKIIYYRNLKEINQQDLAKEIGVTRQYLSKIEHGKCFCNRGLIHKIAVVLEINFIDLIKE